MRVPFTLLAAAAMACIVSGSAAAGASKYGGTLVVGLSSGDPDSLDPTVSRSAIGGTEVFQATCQSLYDTNSKLQLVPVLAAALPVLSKDKLTYTIVLKQGVRFNDGTQFNAQAVVTTVQRMITYPGSAHASDFDAVDSVSASGPYTVVYHLKARTSTFIGGNPYILSPTQLAKLGDNFASNPVCVGPFMFDHRVPGDNITVIKSPYYYDQAHVYLDKIVFRPVADAPSAAAALRAGDIQVLDNVSTTEREGIAQAPGLRVLQAYGLGWLGLQINFGNRNGLGNLPYQNVGTPLATSSKLRQAFEEAIDRTTLNRVVFGGLHQVTCTMIPPADIPWFEATKVPCTPHDPGDAKKLVAASGFTNPTVHLLVSSVSDRLRLAQFIQAQEAAVGINVVIDSFDNPTVVARRSAGNFDVYVGGFGAGGVDPTETIHLATADSRNYSGYSNPRLDLILANGLKATSTTARSTLYRAAQQIIFADRPYIALYDQSTLAACSASVAGVRLTPNGLVIVANAQLK